MMRSEKSCGTKSIRALQAMEKILDLTLNKIESHFCLEQRSDAMQHILYKDHSSSYVSRLHGSYTGSEKTR